METIAFLFTLSWISNKNLTGRHSFSIMQKQLFLFLVQMSLSSLSDCQFFHESQPSISLVHRPTSQAAQVAQHTNSTSPLPSPLHQLHHPQVGGQHSHAYAMRSDSHGSFEPHRFGFKHNQGGSLRGQNHSQGNFSPQRRFVPQGHNTAPGFRNQQQYNRNTWRRRKRDNLPALNQSRWNNEASLISSISASIVKALSDATRNLAGEGRLTVVRSPFSKFDAHQHRLELT